MNNITPELLTEYQTCQQRIKDIATALYEKAEEVCRWEKENLGVDHKYIEYSLNTDKSNCVEFYPSYYGNAIKFTEDYKLNSNHYVVFEVYDSWSYGGYEEKEIKIPLYKLLSDDWREPALKEHLDKLEQERKEKEEIEKEAVRKKEEHERAEYERLKAKYE